MHSCELRAVVALRRVGYDAFELSVGKVTRTKVLLTACPAAKSGPMVKQAHVATLKKIEI